MAYQCLVKYLDLNQRELWPYILQNFLDCQEFAEKVVRRLPITDTLNILLKTSVKTFQGVK